MRTFLDLPDELIQKTLRLMNPRDIINLWHYVPSLQHLITPDILCIVGDISTNKWMFKLPEEFFWETTYFFSIINGYEAHPRNELLLDFRGVLLLHLRYDDLGLGIEVSLDSDDEPEYSEYYDTSNYYERGDEYYEDFNDLAMLSRVCSIKYPFHLSIWTDDEFSDGGLMGSNIFQESKDNLWENILKVLSSEKNQLQNLKSISFTDFEEVYKELGFDFNPEFAYLPLNDELSVEDTFSKYAPNEITVKD
ncbi:hypothetical protein BN7_4662 [Wickerhamomyces ciferrii]|uniref:F-box domain-containing protein n=1 Tax=Wickerhamomyces ciferrii (strain ATCC 14091 / BCRC 22168 / CBS 111 / JCM 3599 / NBRC 0793 / NRRL Y-1031 F-60-10) TaxID=1206466 RepID=K0KUH5_WICCF|nr:uncharacterized protein BN7_4662 [Wickerhamomyces ciferrii]CCH45084.1 hypothetical protein BN7_4662 [Wickerhamomyces ciferrii]